jgi:hypothetical protein
MRSRILALLVILVLMVPMAVFAQDEDEEPTGEGEIRAVWNQEILVLINISDDGVNASNLSLVSENGEIQATDFVMELDDDDVSYSLADVRPGSCLLVYLAGTAPTVPDTVVCTRVIGEFTPENITDIVWDISQGGFTPVVDEEEGEDCSINRTSCDIAVITGGPDYSLEDPNPEYTDIRAIWTQDIFVLINVSNFGVDLSSLTLFSESGEILPETFVMLPDEENDDELFDLEDVRPGSCLIVYLGAGEEMPEMPEDVECTRVISETSLENPGDMVWVFEQGGFSAFTEGNTELDLECSVDDTTTCDITVPNADYDPDMDMDMEEEGTDG